MFVDKNQVDLQLYNLKDRTNKLFKSNKKKNNDHFFDYIKNHILIDLPMSYFENYKNMRAKIIEKAKSRKTILSMHSLLLHDLFRIYTAETKK